MLEKSSVRALIGAHTNIQCTYHAWATLEAMKLYIQSSVATLLLPLAHKLPDISSQSICITDVLMPHPHNWAQPVRQILSPYLMVCLPKMPVVVNFLNTSWRKWGLWLSAGSFSRQNIELLVPAAPKRYGQWPQFWCLYGAMTLLDAQRV